MIHSTEEFRAVVKSESGYAPCCRSDGGSCQLDHSGVCKRQWQNESVASPVWGFHRRPPGAE